VRTEADGSLAIGGGQGGTSVSFAGTAGNRRLSGVANGVALDDAATVGQVQTTAAATLAAAQDYTDGKVVGINNSFLARIAQNNQELRTEINAAAASTAALAGLPQAFVPGKGMFAMGIGGKGDQAAIAFGVGKAFNHPNTPVVRAGAAVNTGNGDVTYNAAVGIHF
jgi:autotransporter adhesin